MVSPRGTTILRTPRFFFSTTAQIRSYQLECTQSRLKNENKAVKRCKKPQTVISNQILGHIYRRNYSYCAAEALPNKFMQSVITQKSLYPAGEFLSLFPEVTTESEDAEEINEVLPLKMSEN